MPFGSPSNSATSSQLPAASMRKTRPYGMSVTYRLPCPSDTGPSRNESVSAPLRFASAHGVRAPRRRNFSGITANTSISRTAGGAMKCMEEPQSAILLAFDVRLLCNASPAAAFVLDQAAEAGRVEVAGLATHCGDELLHVRRRKRLLHFRVQPRDHVAGRALGRCEPRPVDDAVARDA